MRSSILKLLFLGLFVLTLLLSCAAKDKGTTFTQGVPPDVTPPASDTTSPVIAGGINVSSTTVSVGDTVLLAVTATDDSGGVLSYAWSDGDSGGTFTGEGSSVEYSNPAQGTFTITVAISDEAGNATSSTTEVTFGGAGGYFDTLPGGLHGTSSGMRWWYEREDGLGSLIGVSYDDTGCNSCHVYATGEGAKGTASGCSSCHAEDFSVTLPDACIRCHSRQGAEISKMGLPDVHRDGTHFEGSCTGCHSLDEIHGDGNSYDSMHSDGQFKTDCVDCHTDQMAPDPAISEHAVHMDEIHCDGCHLETAITCYNCHFDSLLNNHEKKPYKAFNQFVFLANDTLSGQIKVASYQSVVYEDHTFVAFGPYHGHAITAEGRTCDDCHGIEYVTEYEDTGKIVVTEWDDAANDGAGGIVHAQGVIPFIDPVDFEFQYVGFDGTDWSPSTTTTELAQYEFITPLTEDQLDALSMDFGAAYANLPGSLHGTSDGMRWWFEEPDGFGALSGLSYDDTGCNSCHVYATGEGAMGTEDGCSSCHAADFSVDMPAACFRCHSRQSVEANVMELTDVHTDSEQLNGCYGCHGFDEIHGDGTSYDAMYSAGQFKNDCEDCHSGDNAPPSNAAHSMHLDSLHCDSCHMQTVITCYNCHFDSLVDEHVKRAYQPMNGFVMLANDVDSGKIRPVSYQSVVYGEHQFIAFGAYHSHSVTEVGRSCAECHGDGFSGNAIMEELNTTGKIAVTEWDPAANEGAGGIVHAQGVIPFVPDVFSYAFVDYDSGTETWSPTGVADFDYQYGLIEPLTQDQIMSLGYTPPE